ncbi:MAG: cupin domain-containing protein, partial [Gemmatimonadetes bacterium]|nr:cupin domain-containing protein [Gemmatimonadota bacterium]
MSDSPVRHYRVADQPRETLNPLISRSLITGERAMLAHVYLKKGAVVPMHSHDNEQI